MKSFAKTVSTPRSWCFLIALGLMLSAPVQAMDDDRRPAPNTPMRATTARTPLSPGRRGKLVTYNGEIYEQTNRGDRGRRISLVDGEMHCAKNFTTFQRGKIKEKINYDVAYALLQATASAAAAPAPASTVVVTSPAKSPASIVSDDSADEDSDSGTASDGKGDASAPVTGLPKPKRQPAPAAAPVLAAPAPAPATALVDEDEDDAAAAEAECLEAEAKAKAVAEAALAAEAEARAADEARLAAAAADSDSDDDVVYKVVTADVLASMKLARYSDGREDLFHILKKDGTAASGETLEINRTNPAAISFRTRAHSGVSDLPEDPVLFNRTLAADGTLIVDATPAPAEPTPAPVEPTPAAGWNYRKTAAYTGLVTVITFVVAAAGRIATCKRVRSLAVASPTATSRSIEAQAADKRQLDELNRFDHFLVKSVRAFRAAGNKTGSFSKRTWNNFAQWFSRTVLRKETN